MDSIRLKRYHDKIAYIRKKILTFRQSLNSELERDGFLYNVHTSIEAVIDLIAMMLADSREKIEDDHQNIEMMKQLLNASDESIEFLKKANGMRNILVHRYNGVEEKLVINSKDSLITHLTYWVDLIEGKLHEISK